MKNLIKKVACLLLALSLLCVGAAAAELAKGYFNLGVGQGTFAVGVRTPATENAEILEISGWSETENLVFPFVDVHNAHLGEMGMWISGETEVPRTALYTVSLKDSTQDEMELAYRIWIEGPDPESAANALAVGIEVNDATSRASILSAALIDPEIGGDGPFYPQENGSYATPDIYLGKVAKDTSVTIGLNLMSTATEEIQGDYKITLDIYPVP